MPFDPQGNHSLPSGTIVATGDNVIPSQHNPFAQDASASLSQALLRDGRAPMTGALNMNGNAITGLATSSSPSGVATVGQTVPIGVVLPYMLKTAPAGWIFSYGQVLLPNTPYPVLRQALIDDGFTYGQDGSGNPKVYDGRDVATIGRGNMGGAARGLLSNYSSGTLGQLIGSQSVTLTPAQIAKHKHSGATDQSSHLHTAPYPVFQATSTAGGAFSIIVYSDAAQQVNTSLALISQNFTTNDGNGVNGDAHPNVQPSSVLNFIIKASYNG